MQIKKDYTREKIVEVARREFLSKGYAKTSTRDIATGAGNDWSLSAQYAHKYVAWGNHRDSGLATLRISKDLLHNTMALQTFAYIDVTNGGLFNRLSADYALNDQLHAIVGYDLFHADRGMFATYDNNSELWFKLKYNF